MSAPSIRLAGDQDRVAATLFRRDVVRITEQRSGVGLAVDSVVDGQTLLATTLGRIVASLDAHVGLVDGLPDERTRDLAVSETTKGAPASQIAVLDEPVVHPDFHDGDIETRLKARAVALAASLGARWIFTTCVPSDLGAHRALGFVPCGSPLSGARVVFSIPVVLDLAEGARLRALGSPFVADAANWRKASERAQARVAEAALTTGTHEALRPPDERAEQAARVAGTVRQHSSAFLGVIDAALRSDLLQGAVRLTPAAGEAFVRRGEVGRDLFLVLRGAVEVRRDGQRLAVLGPGDLVGEIAFVMEVKRSADVVAATSDVAVVQLSADRLATLADRDPKTAAALWQGIARALAGKLAGPS